MKFSVSPSLIKGEIDVPGSKSHTIRALVFALLSDGKSVIKFPLDSSDTRSCISMIKKFGAQVTELDDCWTVTGTGSVISVPSDVIDVGNSGTTLYAGMGIASLVDGYTFFTGDSQIRNRPADSLIKSINDLGGEAVSTRNNGKPPLFVRGMICGGSTEMEAVTSQYLTSVLIASPLALSDTHIHVPLLNERPYVEMTCSWLDRLGIKYENRDYSYFFVRGGQKYNCFHEQIPADFSSATFFLVAAAITGAELSLNGLDFDDTQGDKAVVNILEQMGADIIIEKRKLVVRGGELKGGVFNLNSIPDCLPALSVAACFAEGETRLVNVPQARVKETDRISVMCTELKKMGADIEELPDGMIIRKSRLKGCSLEGHGDHRVVMSLSVAAIAAEGDSTISTAESVSVTFPNFIELMKKINVKIEQSVE